MFTKEEQAVLEQAASIIASKIRLCSALTAPEMVKSYCQNKIVFNEQEVFGVLMLDNQHRLIEFVELSRGTINAASVYPREVVKSVLNHNASAVIFTHNHPSGLAEPSVADRRITRRLIDALQLIDVRVLDHIVVGTDNVVSFLERGLI